MSLWASLSRRWRGSIALVVTTGLVGSTLLLGEFLTVDAAFTFSSFIYAWMPLAAGALVIFAGMRLDERGRWAWLLIGLGIAMWGVGEVIWISYSWLLNVEVPYPGIADIFYVAAYPLAFVGMLLLPHMQPKRWQRVRLALDALAGTVAVSAIAWTFYLKDQIYIDPDIGLLEQSTNLGYAVGDILLLIALMFLATRRSAYQFDGRLIALGLGLVVTAIADIAYALTIDRYVEGNWLDGVWLVGYAILGLMAFLLAGPARYREQVDRPPNLAALLAPYGAVLILFVVTITTQSEGSTLQTATAFTGLIIIARQAVAIRETRDVVEKERNDLVASISHELRTPLTAMAGFTEILNIDPDLPSGERREMIGILDSQTQHLTSIVGDLLQVAKDDLSGMDLRPQRNDAGAVVKSAVGIAFGDDLRPIVTTNIAPGMALTADHSRLKQVLVNFLTNASRYGGGAVRIVGRYDGDDAVIEIHDDGPGVARKHEVAIWNRFERGEHRFRSDISGSGLGLAIARQIVAAHGGSTGYMTSPILGGACFWVRLPAAASSTYHPLVTL